MQTVLLPDSLYSDVRRAAEAEGMSVDVFVAATVKERLQIADVDESFFTPERLALIDEADADISAGRFLSLSQLEASLAEVKAEWHRTHRT
jgi:hypothetical protein